MTETSPKVAPSLLDKVVIGPVRSAFNIGMDQWLDAPMLGPVYPGHEAKQPHPTTAAAKQPHPTTSAKQPHPTTAAKQPHPTTAAKQPHPTTKPPKKRRSSTKQLEPQPKKSRFSMLSEVELNDLSKPCIPKNTESSTKWALDNFTIWLQNRNSNSSEQCPESLLEDMNSTQLNKWLSIYIAETRKVNGDPYPPSTLHLLLAGLQRYMRSLKPDKAPNIFTKNDPSFQRLHHTMDSVYRKLRADGVGAQKHSTEVFTKEDENKLWQCGVLGVQDPISLLRAVFFNNGKTFCLRGGEEHRGLRLSQFKRTKNGYSYTENASKNRSGGIAQLHIRNKTVEIFEIAEAGNRCHCRLLDLYISKLPMEAKEKDLFYVRPNETTVIKETTWYYSTPIGRNKLSQMVHDMCKLGNISGHKTNHSLRATGATELYAAEVPEKIIQERTGHRSIEGLRLYERTSEKQHQAVSNILSSTSSSTYQAQIAKIDCSSQKLALNNSSSIVPKMTYNNCQVNINFNQGPAPPVNFVSTPNQQPSDNPFPTMDDVLAFIRDD